jgi:phosphoribosyl 1,2-cyclic phosphodiesterase
VSGREYQKYGGSTTCVEVETDDGHVIILDAGSGIRKLGNTLLKEGRHNLHLVFTHAHWDHILGFPFFRPIYVDGLRLQVYGCPFAQESVRGFLSDAMRPPHFPIDLGMVRAQITYHGICQDRFEIGPVSITPILLSHPNQGLGYKLEADGKRFVFLTDNELKYQHQGGLTFEEYAAFSTGVDLLIHDAEFTEKEYALTRTWGHSRCTDALELGFASGATRLGLFHHNQERSDEAVDGIVADCQRIITERGSGLDCFAVHEGMELEL